MKENAKQIANYPQNYICKYTALKLKLILSIVRKFSSSLLQMYVPKDASKTMQHIKLI